MMRSKTTLILVTFLACQKAWASTPVSDETDSSSDLPAPFHLVKQVATPVALPETPAPVSQSSSTLSHVSKDVPKNTVSQSDPKTGAHRKQVFASAGLNYYHFQLPSFNFPVSNAKYKTPVVNPSLYTGDKARQFNVNEYQPSPFLALRYRFPNEAQFFPTLFGDDLSLNLNLTYVHGTSSDNNQDVGDVAIWNLSGDVNPATPSSSFAVDDASVRSSYKFGDIKAFVSGHKVLSPSVTFEPRIGLVLTLLNQYYRYQMSGETSDSGVAPLTASGNESIQSDYYGMLFGGKLNFQFMRYFSVFADAELQALHAFSQFSGDQLVVIGDGGDPDFSFPSSAKNNQNRFNYRSQFSLGTRYFVNGYEDPDSMSFTLLAGIDYWAYMPKVNNPNAVGSDTARIARSSALNNFIRFTVDVPLIW